MKGRCHDCGEWVSLKDLHAVKIIWNRYKNRPADMAHIQVCDSCKVKREG